MTNVTKMIMTLIEKNRQALAVLLGLSCISFLIYALWQWQADWRLAHQQPTVLVNNKTDNTAEMIANLPNMHLFGKSFMKAGDMPISNLQLKVTGIVEIANEGGIYSKAYISIAGQPDKIYQAGDELPYGVKVYAITPDSVILENDGQMEKLPLPRQKLQFKLRPSHGENTTS